jgi:hypothetical protein
MVRRTQDWETQDAGLVTINPSCLLPLAILCLCNGIIFVLWHHFRALLYVSISAIMNILNSTIIEILDKEEGFNYQAKPFMNHIVVTVPEGEEPGAAYTKISGQIPEIIDKALPEREEDVLFEISSGEDETRSFKLKKG